MALTLQEINQTNEIMTRRGEKVPLSLYDLTKQDKQNTLPEISVDEFQKSQSPSILVETGRMGTCVDRKVSETKSEDKVQYYNETPGKSSLQGTSLDVRLSHSRFTKRSEHPILEGNCRTIDPFSFFAIDI